MIASRWSLASWTCAFVVTAVMAVAISCSRRAGEIPRFPVAGKVLINGAPLATGTILMEGEADAANGLVPAVADIANGAYALQVRAGRMRVRIMAPEEYGTVDDAGERPTRETVAAAFNSNSMLFVEVMADGDNRFDFEVKAR
jgi:hypothetical protein